MGRDALDALQLVLHAALERLGDARVMHAPLALLDGLAHVDAHAAQEVELLPVHGLLVRRTHDEEHAAAPGNLPKVDEGARAGLARVREPRGKRGAAPDRRHGDAHVRVAARELPERSG